MLTLNPRGPRQFWHWTRKPLPHVKNSGEPQLVQLRSWCGSTGSALQVEFKAPWSHALIQGYLQWHDQQGILRTLTIRAQWSWPSLPTTNTTAESSQLSPWSCGPNVPRGSVCCLAHSRLDVKRLHTHNKQRREKLNYFKKIHFSQLVFNTCIYYAVKSNTTWSHLK